MREFALEQTSTLLRKLAAQVNHAAGPGDVEAVHDLRVAIRRLSRCLRLFAQFYPGRGWKKLRSRLKVLMDACGHVRDRDVALDLLAKGGFPAGSIVVRRLQLDRQEAWQELMAELRRWKGRAVERRLRDQLGI
jgi:CHAD domain-containing protein